MSVSLVLNEHPKSVLETETYVGLLAVLERLGGAPEAQLATESHLSAAAVASAVATLHKNQLIDVVRQVVQVSHRGKSLLDRMSLQTAIVDDVLDELSCQGTSRPIWRDVLLSYRDESFGNYLKSLYTVRAWRLLEPEISASSDVRSAQELRQAFSACRLSFFVWDMGGETADGSPNWTLKHHLRESFKSAVYFTHHNQDQTALPLRQALDIVDGLKHGGHINVVPGSSVKGVVRDYLARFFEARARCDQDTWYNVWADLRVSGAIDGQSTWSRVDELLTRYGAGVERLAAHVAGRDDSEDPHLGGRTDVLLDLLTARDFDDFVRRSKMAQGVARAVLETVGSKCRELIKAHRASGSELQLTQGTSLPNNALEPSAPGDE